MLVVTGAAGFIGSCMIRFLNEKGLQEVVAVDDFSIFAKSGNLEGKKMSQKVERNHFFDWLYRSRKEIKGIFHLGARTDTALMDKKIFGELNVNYSKKIWTFCTENSIPLVYASSAATYGGGEQGYKDDHKIVAHLKPLNPYGESKNQFDKWVLQQEKAPPYWAGLKFFNVYGPNEYHKNRMASVIFHAYRQIKQTNGMKLFRSHKAGIADGQQSRDFIYVKDVIQICYYLFEHQQLSGLYNIGTGKARSFLDLVQATFNAMDKIPEVSFIDTPADIRDSYQYFTEASITKLRSVGYEEPFYSLEEGISDYVRQYLMLEKYY